MQRSIVRFVAIPVASAGVLAGAAFAAPAASAATAASGTDTAGSVTHVESLSALTGLEADGITTSTNPSSDESIDQASNTVSFTFPVSGGNGDASTQTGSVDMSGSGTFASSKGSLTLTNLTLNLKNGTYGGVDASGTQVVLQVHDTQSQVSGTSQSYDAGELTMTASAAATFNQALGTTIFAAGEDLGSLTASWTFTS